MTAGNKNKLKQLNPYRCVPLAYNRRIYVVYLLVVLCEIQLLDMFHMTVFHHHFFSAGLGAGKQNEGIVSGDTDAGDSGRPARVTASPRPS